MKFSKDTRPNGVTDKKSAQLLAEALPWIKNITGKTIVIKYGGAAMVDPKLRADVMSDIVAHIHIVTVAEIMAVTRTHIVSVQIPCVGCCADQQKNKLEDQKYCKNNGDACEDLLRQIQCFKPVH